MKNKNSLLWKDVTYKINLENTFLRRELISKYLDKFWKEEVVKIKDTQFIMFIPRAILIDNQYISLSNKVDINKESKGDLLSFLMDRIGVSNEAYMSIPISKLVFSYGIREGKIISQLGNTSPASQLGKDIKYQTYYKNKLPITTNPLEYGKVIREKGNEYTISASKNVFILLNKEISDNRTIHNIEYYKNGTLLFQWKDVVIDQNKFIRYIGKSTIHYDNGEAILYKIERKTSGITKKSYPQITN